MRQSDFPTFRALVAFVLPAVLFAAAAVAQIAVVDGDLETTTGGFRFGDGTLQTTAASGSAAYAGVLVVDSRGGGDFTTIQTAIDAIGATLPAASAANPYLVRVAPGTYSEQVTMKEWVDLEGAGEGTTTITWIGAADQGSAHTVETADNAELRFLSVENTGGAAFARGVILNGGDATRRLYRVLVEVSGATSAAVGVYTTGGSTALLRQVSAAATGSPGGLARALQIENSSPSLVDVDAQATGALQNQAIRISAAAAPTIRGGAARATGTSGSHTAVSLFDSSARIVSLAMRASGGSAALAIASGGTPSQPTTVQASRMEADGTGFNTGAFNNSTQPLRIHGSAITVFGDALNADTDSEIAVSSSLVDGFVSPGGDYVCVASFDGAFSAVGTDCL